MARDEFDEVGESAAIETLGETQPQVPLPAEDLGRSNAAASRDGADRRSLFTGKEGRSPGGDVNWVRASDLLSSSTGRMAGRGIDFEAELARRMRRTPAITRRAIRDRASKLPPLSEFGQRKDQPQVSRPGLGRP
jgi:hypothetical protein